MKLQVAARQLADPPHRLFVAVAEIVHDDHVMPGAEQLEAGVASDVPGAAGDEDDHGSKKNATPAFPEVASLPDQCAA